MINSPRMIYILIRQHRLGLCIMTVKLDNRVYFELSTTREKESRSDILVFSM